MERKMSGSGISHGPDTCQGDDYVHCAHWARDSAGARAPSLNGHINS